MSDDSVTVEEALRLLESAVEADREANSKFEAKLTFAQRCEILVLHRKGCKREVLANLYGVDRRTVTHIHNPNSPRYKNVREEEFRLGRENFLTKYLNAEMLMKAADALKPVEVPTHNKLANRKVGLHMLRNEMCDYDHRVIIQWVEADGEKIPASGWYYKDLDSEWPDDWFTTQDPEALKTSQACYKAAQLDISDKL